LRAIRITEFGGPEVLELVDDQPEPQAGPGTTVLDIRRSGLNYADTHQVENSYLAPAELPMVPGAEAVGMTPDGLRVVALLGGGGYAEKVAAADAFSFEVPDDVDDGQALALVLQGLTAWHLLRTSAKLADGESVVVHAAAGGVGTLAVQLAKVFGAGRVIAVASTEEKRQLAVDLGADATVDAAEPDLTSALHDANGGRKVDVVLEMVGGRTTDQSLAALAPFGRLAFFGMASRTAPSKVDLGELMGRSRGVIGFWLAHCMADPARYLDGPMQELLELTAAGALRPVVGATYGLSEAATAHRDLRERRSIGKLLLDPAG
jgi:NADPH2:quinone reductase